MQVPKDALCPITQMSFEDPVVCADGHSYERRAIETWFARGHRTSPVTNCQLPYTTVVPNHALRNLIGALIPQVQREEQDEWRRCLDLETVLDAIAEDQEQAMLKASAPAQQPALAGSGASGPAAPDSEALRRRRKEEWRYYWARSLSSTETWFIVDRAWFDRWASFADQGGPLPGPISNERLLGAEGRPIPGLRRGADWGAVNESVWKYWHSRYGGGPVLPRQTPDLYKQ